VKNLAAEIPDDKPVAMCTIGELRAVIADAMGIRKPSCPDELLTAEQIETEYHTSRESLKAAAGRGEITLVRGGKRRIMAYRSEVKAWLASRPVAPRMRKAESTGVNIDPIDQMLARGELRAMKGGR